MAITGTTIDNPLSGETLTFVRTAADTDGEALELAFRVRPGGAVAAEHIHVRQVETFTVHQGRARMCVDGVERELGPRETAVVPIGSRHTWSVAGDEELQMTVLLEPALRTEDFFVDIFAMAHDGRTNAKGLPKPLPMAALLAEYPDEVYLAAAPVWLQRLLVRAVAQVSRALSSISGTPASARETGQPALASSACSEK